MRNVREGQRLKIKCSECPRPTELIWATLTTQVAKAWSLVLIPLVHLEPGNRAPEKKPLIMEPATLVTTDLVSRDNVTGAGCIALFVGCWPRPPMVRVVGLGTSEAQRKIGRLSV